MKTSTLPDMFMLLSVGGLLAAFGYVLHLQLRRRAGEAKIRQLTAQLEDETRTGHLNNAERDWLQKELRHRIHNTLQLILSLLSLQTSRSLNDEVKEAIDESRHRVFAISLIHRFLYQPISPATVEVLPYLCDLVNYLLHEYQRADTIRIFLDLDPVELDLATAVPFGLLVNEAIRLSMLYAFSNRAMGVIHLSLKVDGRRCYQLLIRENAVDSVERHRWHDRDPLGIELMQGLAKQLDGKIEFPLEDERAVTITFSRPSSERDRRPNNGR
jgi:two-component sensor histidine kinase